MNPDPPWPSIGRKRVASAPTNIPAITSASASHPGNNANLEAIDDSDLSESAQIDQYLARFKECISKGPQESSQNSQEISATLSTFFDVGGLLHRYLVGAMGVLKNILEKDIGQEEEGRALDTIYEIDATLERFWPARAKYPEEILMMPVIIRAQKRKIHRLGDITSQLVAQNEILAAKGTNAGRH